MLPSPLGIWLESSTGIAIGSSRLPSSTAKQTGSRFRFAQATSMPTKTGIDYRGSHLGPLMEAPQNSKRDNDARRLLRRTGPFNQPRRRPRKKPLFVVFCLIFAVSPSSAELA